MSLELQVIILLFSSTMSVSTIKISQTLNLEMHILIIVPLIFHKYLPLIIIKQISLNLLDNRLQLNRNNNIPNNKSYNNNNHHSISHNNNYSNNNSSNNMHYNN